MELKTAGRPKTSTTKSAAVIGSNATAVQAALSLACMGVEVNLVTNPTSLCWNGAAEEKLPYSSEERRYLWPLLLQAAGHPLITLYSNAEVEEIKGKKGDYKIKVSQRPRYINKELCTACRRCEAECSVEICSLLGDRKQKHSAIHNPILEDRSVPSAFVIDKNGASPCHVACPLGINVQGFVSLLSRGKTNKALALINEAAPLAGILGRVCTHPCESKCNRAEVDSPVSIRALHRYAADMAPAGIRYKSTVPARSGQRKIAIIGSGPAGLTAAWELTRRGYSTTVFESHGVIGGMLATGIPRFRLPREVREREMEAIRKMGVDIRTGITFGRDINYAYLKERGYQAVFLAIGTQRNNSLNIPGEEIDGVVDCMSLLLALNLKLDTFVGQNVAVIGGGNAAIDAARSALRSGAKEVTVFYRRTRTEMPANAEEVDEAIKEGVKIECNVAPVEILGEGGKVHAIHFQRTKLIEEAGDDNRNEPEMINGTDFLVNADHVVVAIGQSPDASQLNMRWLLIDEDTGAIHVDPLTLATSVPGVFAGGDCITGPNNVVAAMADGLRAAESIDRYLQGRDLKAERSLEPPKAAEVDLKTMEISLYGRVKIPVIQPKKRKNTYEETTLGISDAAALRETQRCLNCALCSRCMECTMVCELGAVLPDDKARQFEIKVNDVLRFPSDEKGKKAPAGIKTIYPDSRDGLTDELLKSMALALETTVELRRGEVPSPKVAVAESPESVMEPSTKAAMPLAGGGRVGVFLCSCGGSISSVIDFRAASRRLSAFPGVGFVSEIAQACTEAGARKIAEKVAQRKVERIVVAACRCCNLEQVCYGCTDRRQMCQQYIKEHLILPHGTIVEFCNIREQCAWIHGDDPKGATRKALPIIAAGVACAQITPHIAFSEGAILPNILVLGGRLANAAAARAMASRGYRVELVSRDGLEATPPDSAAAVSEALERFQEKDLTIRPWPDSLELQGSPGNYDVVLKYGQKTEHLSAGAVLVDVAEIDGEGAAPLDTSDSKGLLRRILSRQKNSTAGNDIGGALRHEVTIGDKTGIFVLPSHYGESPEERVLLGLATAARISAYIEQKTTAQRDNAVDIDSQRCRGCGDCADLCSYIEMRELGNGMTCAMVNKTLCLGCGACAAVCPTGAITQPYQSDAQIIATLSLMLQKTHAHSEV